jgi:beta-lactamase superfamily II metal-dependent hydrolase
MNPPAGDEVEVTLLGRGVGECVVLHLLDNVWIIVDSFSDVNSGRPAARDYLDSLGVAPDAVKTLVVTHFHADHYRGIDRLHDYYSSARLMVTGALKADQFLALYDVEDESSILGRLPGTIKRAYDRTLGSSTPALRHLQIGQQVYVSATAKILALSPTDAAIIQSNKELAQVMRAGTSATVRSKLRDDNRCSVVLHVNIEGMCALLGADLVGDTAEYGWHAVLEEPNHSGLEPADLVKVPHHGGSTAHDDAMWADLVGANPILKIAPYWPSGLPTAADVERLSRYGEVWQAAPSVGYSEDEFGNRISSRAVTGLVQARRRKGEASWRIVTEGPAFRAAPPESTA